MNISLTPELEKFVADQVKSGQYKTSSEVVREALRSQLKQSIESSLDMRIATARVQVEQGKTTTADKKFFESKRQRVRAIANNQEQV